MKLIEEEAGQRLFHVLEILMNEDKLNIEIRKFLKHVGITSQREIEHAVSKALEAGDLAGTETLAVKMELTLPALNLKHQVEGQIELE